MEVGELNVVVNEGYFLFGCLSLKFGRRGRDDVLFVNLSVVFGLFCSKSVVNREFPAVVNTIVVKVSLLWMIKKSAVRVDRVETI